MKYNFKELKEIVKSKMSLKRFTHTLGVVEMSEKLAKIYFDSFESFDFAGLSKFFFENSIISYIVGILLIYIVFK